MDAGDPNFFDLANGRWLLEREGRWRREFRHVDGRHRYVQGLLGSVDDCPTLAELQAEWATWSDVDRRDFCDVLGTAPRRADLQQILRFVWENGSPPERSRIAIVLGSYVEPEVALPLLADELGRAAMQDAPALLAALSDVAHPDSARAIRSRLELASGDACLWTASADPNVVAYVAVVCVRMLIELGAEPREFGDLVHRLSEHTQADVRNEASFSLSRWYEWLPAWREPG